MSAAGLFEAPAEYHQFLVAEMVMDDTGVISYGMKADYVLYVSWYRVTLKEY